MKAHRIFVLSNLNLGGSAQLRVADEEAHARMASFIHHLGRMSSDREIVHLVIAGNLINFPATLPPVAFAADEDDALARLLQVLQDCDGVFESLAEFVATGHRLTLLLGAAEAELALARPREALLSRIGPGNVEFLYDGEPFTIGPLLVEAGYRADPWTRIDHEALRRFRLARRYRMEAPPTPVSPARRLYASLIAPLSLRYPGLPLLSEDHAALLPLLLCLEPSARSLITALAREMLARQDVTVADRAPWDETELDRLSSGSDLPSSPGSSISGRSGWTELMTNREAGLSRVRFSLLQSALRASRSRLDTIAQDVWSATRRSFEAFRVVVIGREMHAKFIRDRESVLLCGGSWCPALHLPVDDVELRDSDAAEVLSRCLLSPDPGTLVRRSLAPMVLVGPEGILDAELISFESDTLSISRH